MSVCPRWTSDHVAMVTACLEAGCNVYSEKPMTATLADGDIIVEMAKARGLKVAVAHQAVYLPATHAIRKMLNDGKIGTIQAIYASGKQDRRGGGEDMIVLGTHTFNMMRFFVGDVAWMQSHVTANGKEIAYGDDHKPTEPVGPVAGDCINSYFAFKSGISGFFQSRRDQAGAGRYGMEIVGSEGTFSLRGDVANRLMVYPYPVLVPANSDQEWEAIDLDDTPFSSGNELAIRDLIDAVENDRKPISAACRRCRCTGDDSRCLRVSTVWRTRPLPNCKPRTSPKQIIPKPIYVRRGLRASPSLYPGIIFRTPFS